MIYTPYKPLAFLLCAYVLMGCTSYSENHGFSTYRPNKVTQYFHYLRNLPSEELIGEYEKAKAAYDKNQSDATSLRLVLFLILPHPKLNDDLQAVHILKSILRSNQETTDSRKHFVFLLTYLVDEISKKEVLYEYSNHKLKEEVKKNKKYDVIYHEANKKLSATIEENKQQELFYKKTEQTLREKEQLIDRLQRKIERLKAIEKHFNRRRHVKPPST